MCFDALLRLLHPLVPFVTEELWRAVTGGESIVVAPWPGADAALHRPGGRGGDRRAPGAGDRGPPVPFRPGTEARPEGGRAARPGRHGSRRARGGDPRRCCGSTSRRTTFAATARLDVGGVTVEIDTAGAIDVAAERKRLEKDLAAARKEAAQAAAKLGNEQFMAKAPDDVVAKVRARAAQAEEDIARPEAQLARSRGLSPHAGGLIGARVL